ncbi:TPA: cell division inhibitor protein [Citrobacter amalonaticus]|nr:cell division inhibitor protein [Citrobacter amalonaticus]
MEGQHYGIQETIRATVRPGMLIRHDGLTWKAGANTRGKLIIHTMQQSSIIKDCFVNILLDGRGEPLGNYSRDTQWTGQT